MSDLADFAAIAEERNKAWALQAINTAPEANATGYCLNCDAPLAGIKRWCDTDCREDWQKLKRAEAQRSIEC